MVDFSYKGKELVIATKEKKEIVFHTEKNTVSLDGYDVTHP